MKRTVFLALFAISLLVFAVPYANASPASAQLVAQGRALLSNNANPTYSGILAANDKFKAAVIEDSNDPEANIFYAVTRIIAFGLKQGSGAGIETLADLFEAFGMPRSSYEYVDDGPPWEEPPEIYDHVVPPETAPSGEEVRAFLGGHFVDLLDAALANLNKVGSDFATILTTAETGEDHVIEVDYGDVLLFRSAVYTIKSFVLLVSAYDLDVNPLELAVLGNAGVLQIQRDLLDKYQDLLKLLPTNNASANGSQLLSAAREALLYGIIHFKDAFDFIDGEFSSADPQDDELFSFEREADVNEARYIRKLLSDLQASLVNNQILTVNDNYESWSLNDGQGRWAYLSLERHQDERGQFFVADYRGYNECWNFIGCGGSIDNITVTGNNIVIETTGSSWFNFRIEGTLTDSAHFSGTYTASDPYNSWNGTITGDRMYSENEQDSFDFNRVFGNTNKLPLDIRAVLPEFCMFDEIIPGTFPGDPVLNGILPDITTNEDLTREMDLQPCGFFNIPTVPEGEISMDGSLSDWPTTSSLAFTDLVDDENEYANFSGMDIHRFYLAKDSTYLYVGIDLYDGDPNTIDLAGYTFQANASWRNHDSAGDRVTGVFYSNEDWIVNVSERTGSYGDPIFIASFPPEYAAAGTKFIEWKVPLNDANGMGNLSGKYICVQSGVKVSEDPDVYVIPDDNLTRIMLDPSSISGTVTCPGYDGTGNIFVWAFDGPDWRYARELGNAVIADPGSYTIEGLPIGQTVYIAARWDADNNGIKTFGDYMGMTGPHTVASGGITVAPFSVDNEIDENEVMIKEGLYRIFGSNTFTWSVYGGFFDIDWGDDWEFIGEGNSTQTFTSDRYYERILLIWDKSPTFSFDSFEDLTANTAFGVDEYGNPSGYSWSTGNLRNHFYFVGHPDGLCAVTVGRIGYALFPMPLDTTDNNAARQLKITLVSILLGDVDGDTDMDLADAILALQVLSGISSGSNVNMDSDVNEDDKIGLAEVIYVLQDVSGLR